MARNSKNGVKSGVHKGFKANVKWRELLAQLGPLILTEVFVENVSRESGALSCVCV
jgi:hypothetical protein